MAVTFQDRRHIAANLEGDVVMKAVMNRVNDFIRSEDGPTATEYAVMLALIIIVALAAIGTLGSKVNAIFGSVQTELTGAGL